MSDCRKAVVTVELTELTVFLFIFLTKAAVDVTVLSVVRPIARASTEVELEDDVKVFGRLLKAEAADEAESGIARLKPLTIELVEVEVKDAVRATCLTILELDVALANAVKNLDLTVCTADEEVTVEIIVVCNDPGRERLLVDAETKVAIFP